MTGSRSGWRELYSMRSSPSCDERPDRVAVVQSARAMPGDRPGTSNLDWGRPVDCTNVSGDSFVSMPARGRADHTDDGDRWATRYQGLIRRRGQGAHTADETRTSKGHDGDRDAPLIDFDVRGRAREALVASEPESRTHHRRDAGAGLVGSARWERRLLQSALPGLHRLLVGPGERSRLGRRRPPGGPDRLGGDVGADHGVRRSGRGRSATASP